MSDSAADNLDAHTSQASDKYRPAPSLLNVAAERHAQLAALLIQSSGGASPLQNEDFVHDLRVATRRMGEVVRLLSTFLDKSTARAVKETLQSLRRALGELRDGDVMCAHLLQWRMPAPVRQVAKDAAARIIANRPALVFAATQQMTAASVQGTMVVLAKVLEDQSRPENLSNAEARLRKLIDGHLKHRRRQLKRAFGRAAIKQTAESLHTARIVAKKFRYVAELADASGALPLKREVKFLKRLQELLGGHHDVHVIVQILAAHLHDSYPDPLPALSIQWRKWLCVMERAQAKRAADFFMLTYAWINRLLPKPKT